MKPGLTLLIIGWAVGIVTLSQGQSVEPNVSNSAGFNAEPFNISVTSSIGETAITTITSGGSVITQGFLQPEFYNPCNGVELRAFPNPVVETLTIEVQHCEQRLGMVQIYDLWGKLILESSVPSNKIDVSQLPTSFYLVRAFTPSGTDLGSLKIYKIRE